MSAINISCLRFAFHIVDQATGAGIAGAVFRLTGGASPRTATSNGQGRVEFCPLCPGSYVLTEEIPPAGYAPNTTQYRVRLDGFGRVWVNGQLERNFTIASAPAAVLINVSGQKLWEDMDNLYNTRPLQVSVALYRNGSLYRTAAVSAQGNGAFLFEGLPLLDPTGQPYVYTVGEAETPEGYSTTVSGTTITNELLNVVITGEWTSYGGNLALINDNRYAGDFGSPVVEAGVLYAYNDPALLDPLTSVAVLGSPFYAFLTGLSSGTWYYAAYVRTQDGYMYRGEIKSAIYP